MTLFLFVGLIETTLARDGTQDAAIDPYGFRITNACGPTCVVGAILVSHMPRPSSDFLLRLVQTANAYDAGMSMGEITQFLVEAGVTAEAKRIPLKEVLKVNEPFIALVKANHFSLIIPALTKDDLFWAVSYPDKPKLISPQILGEEYSGFSVLFGRGLSRFTELYRWRQLNGGLFVLFGIVMLAIGSFVVFKRVRDSSPI